MEDRHHQYMNLETVVNMFSKIHSNPGSTESCLLELCNILPKVPSDFLEENVFIIFSALNAIFSRCNENISADQKVKCRITEALKIVFDKVKLSSIPAFYNIYIFLLKLIFDKDRSNSVADIQEEYKLSIIMATTSLFKSMTSSVKLSLYNRERGICLSQMLQISIETAKNEKLRSLRLASIDCIMALAQIHKDTNIDDIGFRQQVADLFIFFTPGIISGLATIATEDDKCGHKIITEALHAWGKIVAFQMYDYNIPMNNFICDEQHNLDTPNEQKKDSYKLGDNFESYIQNKKMDSRWYKETDEKLQKIISLFTKLTWHLHPKVRLELAHTCLLITRDCFNTIPTTVSKAVEILIKLSEDEDDSVNTVCKSGLRTICVRFSSVALKSLLENLEERFFASLTAMPRIFNSFDEKQQLSSLNLLIGYLRTFGSSLEQVLLSAGHSKRLLDTLLHISEIERQDIKFEEQFSHDLRLDVNLMIPWKNFRYFHNNIVAKKIEVVCMVLADLNTADEMTDLLISTFLNCEDKRREATYILNNMLAGIPDDSVEGNLKLFRTVIDLYMDPEFWKIPLQVSSHCLLPQVQYNVIQICLQMEGIGIIATKMKEKFEPLLCRILYPLLEHAGSVNPSIKTTATSAIAKISLGCGYDSVTTFINKNSDYYSFHVINKMHKSEESLGAICVLTAVMKYSDISILPSISDVIFQILSQTYDKYFRNDYATAYLQLFKIFVESLRKWLSIEVVIEPIKTKQEKEEEHEHFYISNTNNDPVDERETVEELCKEEEDDVLDELEDEKNEKVPPHVLLTVSLLKRALHFLPIKNRTNKLLVLDIVNNGLEVIRIWENHLLPIVHQIWSPLVERFKEKDDPVIINKSFELLVTLARLSKDFIRFRTAKDLLPSLITILKDLAKQSYLKDHGASYRYTQSYKMQLNILQQLSRVVTNLDMADSDINVVMNMMIYYISNKQPIPLQNAAKNFYMDLLKYDPVLTKTMLNKFLLSEEYKTRKTEYEGNIQICLKTIL